LCSGSEAGSYLRLIDLVYHSTLGLIVIKKKKRVETGLALQSMSLKYDPSSALLHISVK